MAEENVDDYANLTEEWMREISQARAFNKHDVKENHARQFLFLLESLSDSTRRCMDPVDYVYGVLGMLNIKIPRMTDPKAVWQRFLSELDNYMDTTDIKNEVIQVTGVGDLKIIGVEESAYRIDLRKATWMGYVYDELLEMDDISSDEE